MHENYSRLRQDVQYMKGHVQEFLAKLARKRVREEARQTALCKYTNPATGKMCASYKTHDSPFCNAHDRLNPYGENHLFKKKEERELNINENLFDDDDFTNDPSGFW
jgi:hypothetical protein